MKFTLLIFLNIRYGYVIIFRFFFSTIFWLRLFSLFFSTLSTIALENFYCTQFVLQNQWTNCKIWKLWPCCTILFANYLLMMVEIATNVWLISKALYWFLFMSLMWLILLIASCIRCATVYLVLYLFWLHHRAARNRR